MTYIQPNQNGQATMANSAPVVISSDQSAVPVSGTVGVTSATLATTAKQDTIIGHVDGIETLLGTIDADTSAINATIQVEDDVYTVRQRLSMSGGMRRDADTSPVSATGDVHPLVFDETGRLKVSTYPASTPTYTDTITSNGDIVSLDVSRYSNLMIHCKGTFSTVNCTFEGSIDGGTTWFTTQAVRTNANTIETTTGNLSAAPAYAWELSVNAMTNFRVRATAFASGTQTWVFVPGTYATEPIPAVQSSAVTVSSGTVTTVGTVTNITNQGQIVDNAAFTDGTTRVMMNGYIYDEVAGTALTENDGAAARINVNRAQVHAIEDGVTRGRYATVSASNALKVDGSAVTQPVSGTFWQATQPVSIATAPVLVAGSAVIGKVGIDQTTPGTTNKVDIGTNGTVAITGTVTVGSHAVTNAGTFAVQAASAGDVANDGVDSGNPIKVGGVATITEQTAVSASGDRVNASFTSTGKQIVQNFSTPEYFVSGAITTAMTSTTSTSLVAAPGAGLRNYITTIIVSNAHATVGTDVAIQDGSGGTTLMTIPAAAVYGGAVITLPIPLRQPTTNTALYCANVTTGASTKVSAVGYKGV